MAYSAGSIAFSGLPNQYTVITINDGQSAVYSTLKLGVQINDSSQASIFVSGTTASNNVMDGNASDLVTVYQQGNTSRRPFFDFSLVAGGASFADWKAAFKDDGTAPAKLQFKQPGFGGFTIDFVDLSSGFTATSGLGSYGRDNGTGDYSINLNSITNLSNTMNTIESIFTAANTAGEADFYTSQLSVSSNYLRVMDDRATSAANVLSLALVPSGSASWTDAGVVAWKVGTDRGNNNMASVQTANEVVYAARGASGDSSSTLSTAQFATYIGALINNLPIQITAAVSDSTVSLTNDVEGTAGNVTITTTDATNITLSGMSGGASSVGGSTKMKTRINNNQLQKLEKHDKVDAKAINITGSAAATGSLVPTAVFTVQQPGIESQKITAATMQDYFSNTDLVEATDDLAYKLIFASGSGDSQVLKVDDDTLTWNANDEVLTIAGSVKATIVSGSGDSTIHKVTMNQLVASTADINGGSIDGATVGASSQSSVKATTLSGSSTLHVGGIATLGDGALTISSAGLLSSSATATLNGIVLGTADINGGSIDNATIGATTQSSVKATTISGSSTLHVGGIATYGDGALTISAAGLISGSATATLNGIVLGTADINGGSIDNATIGATTQSSVKATTLSGSSTLHVGGVATLGDGATTISAAGVVSSSATATLVGLTVGSTGADINGQLDVAGATSLAASGLLTDIRGTLSVDQAATFDSSVTVTGDLIVNGTTTTVDSQNLQVEDPMILMGTGSSGEGSAADRGLIMAISGATNPVMFWDNSATEFAFARSETSGSTNTIDVDAYADLRVLDFYGRALSGSGDSTIHKITMNQLVASTADINGGSIDGATVGASSQSSVKATTLSGSSTLHVGGIATYGDGALTISAAGLLSSSATATLNGIVLGTADINGGSVDNATIGATTQSSVKATTLSGSSTLSLEGVASFGPGAKTVIAVDGGLTIDHFDANWTNAGITVADLGVVTTVDLNGGSIDGTVIGAAVQAAGEFTTVSGSGNLDMGGEVQLDGVAEVVADIDADSFYFLDSDGLMKRDVMSDVLALAKGDGIQVSSAGLFSVPMVEHVYMSASSQHSHVTSSNQANVTSSAFTLGGNNYDTGMVTASFDVYLNGMLQTRSGSWDGLSADSSAYDYIITGSGATVLFENGDEVSYQIDDDDVVVIKYLVK
ncbi:hypothetical protein OAA64_00825 [bacterium]|nr:hypothetical protein [bacterium]